MLKKAIYWMVTYRWWLIAYIIIFNMALLVQFLYDNNWIGNRYNAKMLPRITRAFEQQSFKPEVFHKKESIIDFINFLNRQSDTLMHYHTHEDFKTVTLDNGGTVLYQKKTDAFHFNNQKAMYVYIPENLRDSLKNHFIRLNGMITGFSLESAVLGDSKDDKTVNIRLHIKETNEMYQNYISHTICKNRKIVKTNQDNKSLDEDYLVKDTLFYSNVHYIISAFLALEP